MRSWEDLEKRRLLIQKALNFWIAEELWYQESDDGRDALEEIAGKVWMKRIGSKMSDAEWIQRLTARNDS